LAFLKKFQNSLKKIVLDEDLEDEGFSQENISYTEEDLERKFQEGYKAAKKELEAKEVAEAKKELAAKKVADVKEIKENEDGLGNIKLGPKGIYTEDSINLSMKSSILFIEDDRDMRDLVAGHLAHSGFDVQTAEDGIQGQALALKYSPDLILLDLMLPNVDGLTLCQRLRRDERTSNIPTLMITALGGLKDKVTGFSSGADDYITKPFDLEELHVRIKALLRKTNRAQLNSSNQQEILNYGPLTLVPERFEAIWFESPVRLTHLEFELLHCLLQRHGQTVSPALILKEVWGYEPDDDIETIRVHIRHLRTKLEPDPRKPIYIKTVYGAGYCINLPSRA
tara:strand:- start:396 stop:1412 length:1017 start_codon:yes stop_codon:yes gene_type:complete